MEARPAATPSHNTPSGGDPAELAMLFARASRPGQWAAVSLRRPTSREKERAGRWWRRRLEGSPTHYSNDIGEIVASVIAGGDDPSDLRALARQVIDDRLRALKDVPGLSADGAMVAKLRYCQTKIAGAPETILVGDDVVAVTREQQVWVREHYGLAEGERLVYLFPALTSNPRGLRPRTAGSYLVRLGQLDRLVSLTDSHGRPLSSSKSRRLRHTKATTLLNLGAPVHVVQRYMGHRSPAMLMHYAQTLATTAEREFLALARPWPR